MKLLTLGGGFTEEELGSFTHIIYSNCISQMKILVSNLGKLDIEYEVPENEVSQRTPHDMAPRITLTGIKGSRGQSTRYTFNWRNMVYRSCR